MDSVKLVGHVISSVRPGMPPPTVTKDGRLVAPCRHRKRDALEVPCGTNADLRFFSISQVFTVGRSRLKMV